MAKRQPFKIAGEIFKTKAALTERIKLILNGAVSRVPLGTKDFEFMLEVLHLHPMAVIKIGVGVSAIFVDKAPEWTSRCFFVRRTDQSKAEFSFHECLKGTTHEGRFLEAARAEIEDQVVHFRESIFAGSSVRLCALTGASITRHESHIDHIVPFNKLVEAFTANFSLDVATVKYTGWDDGAARMRFADPVLAKQWSDFHREKAELRITAKSANLQRPRKSNDAAVPLSEP